MTKARIWGFGAQDPAASERGLLRGLGPFAGKAKEGDRQAPDHAESLLLMRNFEQSGVGWFWSGDAEGRFTYVSNSFVQTLGEGAPPFLGQHVTDLFSQADDDRTGRQTLAFILAKQSKFERVVVRVSHGDDPRFWSIAGHPQYDEADRFIGFRGSAIDVTDQRRSSEKASQLAKYDVLTGLPNRRRMSEALDASLAAAEHGGRSSAVLLIDLDRFKQVNDTLGHPAGDALLKQVADRLSRIVGDREQVFRLGGDEFQVILPNCEDRGIIGELAANIIASLSQPYSVEGSRCVIGASVGVAIAPLDGANRSELIRNADLALYAAKFDGRGRFRFFSNELLRIAEDKRVLEEDLRDALARGEISLAYQPVVNATTHCMTGVEALIRWTHPHRGPISPAVFIPIAEEAGLVAQLGKWALRKACEDAATWPGKLRVAVNVSPIQFTNESLPATITSALAATGLSADRLELEITEGVFLGDSPSTDSMFASLKTIGVRLALDDFGTGYSSLGYLRSAPFDKIKIDRTFVLEATLPGSRNGAIIAAIVALAEALGMETTAEGIEYLDQLQLIRSLRVSHVQGWVYSKALTHDELVARLEAGDLALQPTGPARQRSTRQAIYRKVGIIFGQRYRPVIMRNLSESGALIEAPAELAPGTVVVVDFGDGQITFARVTRVHGRQLGIAFEQDLVDDGNGGLCTSHRVSPYLLATLGLPSAQAPDRPAGPPETPTPFEVLASKLGLSLAPRPLRQSAPMTLRWSPGSQGGIPTFRDIAERYLQSLGEDEAARESADRDLGAYILPRFGELRLNEVTDTDLLAWLAEEREADGEGPGTNGRLRALLGRMWAMAKDMKLPGAEHNPLEGSVRFDRHGKGEAPLTAADGRKLLEAARASPTGQLKFILALLMLTGARPGEILAARWDQIDLKASRWHLRMPGEERARELSLSRPAVALLAELPRFERCPWVVPNPATRKPYGSILRSWEAVRAKAGLPYLEIDDLRYCDLGAAVWEESLLAVLREGAELEAERTA